MSNWWYWNISCRMKKFPIKAVIFKKLQNGMDVVISPARFETTRNKTEDGMLENSYMVLLNEKKKIPAPEPTFYNDIGGQTKVFITQMDRFTYYPGIWDNGKLKFKVAQPKVDPVTNDYIRNDKGEVQFEYTERVMHSMNVVLNNGKLEPMQELYATKTYDKESWLSKEIEYLQRFYRSKGFWEKYGSLIIMAVMMFFMIMVLYIGISQYAKITQTFVDGVKSVGESIVKASANAAQAGSPHPIPINGTIPY